MQKARAVHTTEWTENEVQLCTLLSIKTGGCSEDCAYCSQSARYKTDLAAQRLMKTEDVLPIAVRQSRSCFINFPVNARR